MASCMRSATHHTTDGSRTWTNCRNRVPLLGCRWCLLGIYPAPFNDIHDACRVGAPATTEWFCRAAFLEHSLTGSRCCLGRYIFASAVCSMQCNASLPKDITSPPILRVCTSGSDPSRLCRTPDRHSGRRHAGCWTTLRTRAPLGGHRGERLLLTASRPKPRPGVHAKSLCRVGCDADTIRHTSVPTSGHLLYTITAKSAMRNLVSNWMSVCLRIVGGITCRSTAKPSRESAAENGDFDSLVQLDLWR
ncbi:hypothetical protein B0T18DRAFT_124483 [Schizothecium vesticola]|uniref:Uncharacterized protein n=1 Tax=Schizothecium vesticola TaxID=314040 RepID=A0AA40F307_9PEZI|nr:hypothetical protein B0T18DRAFT_124483 [Schizothecium vesticola]